MSKTVTGIGYLLMILGLLVAVGGAYAASVYAILGGAGLAIIGYLLINIGFIIMGRKYHKGAWTATGVIGIIVFLLLVAALAVIAGAVASALSNMEMGEGMGGLESVMAGAAGMIGIAGILSFVWIIMEIIVLWSAAGYFGSGVLKGAAILKIIVLILSLVAVPVLAVSTGLSFMSGSPEATMALGATAIAVVGLDILLLIVSLILAGIGFLTAKEPTTYTAPAYTAQVAPPPPPA